MPSVTNALNRTVALDRPARRVVSLVPSLTEAVAEFARPGTLVGVTKFCVEPPALTRPLRKVGGTKDPDIDAIVALHPDLVVANQEENRREDVEALWRAGVTVFVGCPRSVAGAVAELGHIMQLLGIPAVMIGLERRAQAELDRQAELNQSRPRVRVFCPIWRNPYLAVGGDTYAGDLLRLLGGRNVFESHRGGARYPQVTLAEVRAADPQVILLPSEPYRFSERHRQEWLTHAAISAVRDDCVFLVDGRWLTWYGPRIPAALEELETLLDRARPDWTAPEREERSEPPPRTEPEAPAPPALPAPRRAASPRPSGAGAALPPHLRFNPTQRDVVDEGNV